MVTSTLTPSAILLFVAVITGGSGSVAVVASTALDAVCGGLGGYYVTPEVCVSALCPGPSSSPCRAAPDGPAVAAIAARLAAANATAARDSVAAALPPSSGGDAAAEEAVRACLRLYGGVVPALQWAARSVAAGRLRGAREVMQAAQRVPAGCDGMAEGAAAAALPPENDAFGTMATVAHAVLASLTKGY